MEGSDHFLKCFICGKKIALKNATETFLALSNFTTRYNQLINTGTIIINNNYNNELDFSCDISLDPKCGSGEYTSLCNQILDGHKPAKMSELLSRMNSKFIYSTFYGSYYMFDGNIWEEDKEYLNLRLAVIALSSLFDEIQKFYESKPKTESNTKFVKNVKSLITSVNKAGTQNEIFTIAKSYYKNKYFHKLLNCKKHLVPFTNGAYDLVSKQFRKIEKEDYITLTLGYDYDPTIRNEEVIQFVKKILPDKSVRDYVLKKMSECLNGDIPNTHFLMLIGDGANGKSQLLNLMKLAMGQLAEKVEVTLLTRKRNNANEANPEKIKLMHKRFAYLSEPEDKEKINISLLKELTGSEEIVARDLYEGSMTFVMETKLFLACNELPEIKGEDSALWRRIKVINFPSRSE
jgi:phage/plasmid-associated DNA primase